MAKKSIVQKAKDAVASMQAAAEVAPDSGENFYSPAPSPEQQQANEKEAEELDRDLPVIRELIDDFDKFVQEARSIMGITVGNGVDTDAQLLAKQIVERWAVEKRNKYVAKYRSARPLEEIELDVRPKKRRKK